MAIQLGADLQRAAGSGKTIRARTQHAADVTQPGRCLVTQAVGIDTCSLWRDVGANAQLTPTHLVGQLEGLQVKIFAGAGQQ